MAPNSGELCARAPRQPAIGDSDPKAARHRLWLPVTECQGRTRTCSVAALDSFSDSFHFAIVSKYCRLCR